MAELSLGSGRRWGILAKLIAENDKDISLREEEHEIIVSGPYITVTMQMIQRACFPEGVKHPKALDRILYGLALQRKGRLIVQTEDKIVIGDDDGERAMTLRLRYDQLQDVIKYSDDLGISRNKFITDAIEYYVKFLTEARNLDDLLD